MAEWSKATVSKTVETKVPRGFESYFLCQTYHSGCSVAWPNARFWEDRDRQFKSGHPDQLRSPTMTSKIRDYTSDRVFDGVRILTQKQREEHLERLKRALEKRNNGK
jgi:hypothetical protein